MQYDSIVQNGLRVLLTGGAGFVGHHTLDYLLEQTDWNFVVTDSFKHYGISARLRSVLEKHTSQRSRVKVITHDLTTPIDLITIREIGTIDIIINMASGSNVDQSIRNPRHFVENNVQLALTMLEYARTLSNLKLFIQVSTDEVFGPAPLGVFHGEWDSIVPSNPYSASKASQEALAISYWRTYGVPVLITNTMNIIGERQDVEKFVPLCIARIMAGEKVPVHAKFLDGKWISGSRFYLHAKNQADALKFLVSQFSNTNHSYSSGAARPLRFNVRGEIEKSNDEMVDLIANFLGKGNQNFVDFINVEGARPGHDLRYALDGQALFDLGWTPPVSFENSLREVVEWTSRNPLWLQG
jgi:dTDP-glucose 4,6-dehydratase